MWWLLEAGIRRQLEQARAAGIIPTAEQTAHFASLRGTINAESNSRIMAIAGDTAEISVKGVLTQEADFFAMLFGGGNTTFPEIISALAEAEANPAITKVVLAVDSPGGTVAGLFETIAAIESFSKPIESVVSNLAASAAFAIVASTDKITATNRATTFGSVGIVAQFFVDEDVVTITSTDAPKKRPDVTTEEGVAAVREELDALHEIFVDAIAAGRGTTAKKVNAEFGQGGVFLADEALKRGMIDAVVVAQPSLSVVAKPTARKGGTNSEKGPMDLQELKAQHPAVYAAAVGVGVEEGTKDERDRVAAHLTMGEASGDMKTAVAAIGDGSGMTVSLQATYMAAGMNRRDINDRQDDDAGADAGTAALGQDDAAREATVADNILAAAAASCNVEMGA